MAIAWDSNPAGDYATDPLEADLDLWVLDPGGIAVAGSTSWDNSYEIVDFTPTTTGTYTFRITAPTYSGAAEYVGLAWWLDHLPLASHAPVTADVPPVSRDYYRFNPVGSAWNVLALRSPAGADYDLWLVEGNAFGDPDDHQMAAWSTDTARVDFVAVDNHHEPASTHYAETSAWVGTGAYAIEFASPTASIAATGGSFGGTFWDDEVVYIYDSSHQPGVRKYYRVAPTGGSPDFGLALLESHPGDPGTYHQGRASAVAVADVQGAGIWEALNWQSTADDSYALVIFRNDAVGTGGYSLYADTTAPTGAVMINDGAFSTPTSNVTLSLPAADAQTGLWRMAVHNAGTSWPVDIDYVPTIPFSLLPGEGWRTVEVNYVNRAFMRSVTYTDTIFVHPLLLMFDGFESGSTSAWRWRWP